MLRFRLYAATGAIVLLWQLSNKVELERKNSRSYQDIDYLCNELFEEYSRFRQFVLQWRDVISIWLDDFPMLADLIVYVANHECCSRKQQDQQHYT